MFEINHVSKQYGGEFALRNISMTISKGLNFIVGASGSGKTTLLKILCGLEQDFDGEVLYCGKHIKSLSSNEKGYFYNNIFGFVWQDFNLLEDSTVLENVLLPQFLKDTQNSKLAQKTLRDLKIDHIATQKVKSLSGGQKQRVAIARELMKNPQVIIADEPTSALDAQTAKATMEILRTLSKSKTVIVVTHDTSLMTAKDHIYELDKGELVSKSQTAEKKPAAVKLSNSHSLSIKNACSLALARQKNNVGRFVIATLAVVIASVLLLTTVSGSIGNSAQSEFDKLLKTYGESLLDMNIIDSFTDASGTSDNQNKKPDGTVTQNIDGLYQKYATDERLSIIAYMQSFNDIQITVDGKNYQIQSSGNAPVINKITAGQMPMGNTNQVVVPESFADKLGVSNEQAIGKTIDFSGAIYDWSTGQPVLKPVTCKATIVGVIDTTATYEYEGKINSFTLDDCFFFSLSALQEMTTQAGTSMENADFLMRAKTPSAMIEIKDELSAMGIVPIGRFELVEDMVRLNEQTTAWSGSANVLITLLSLVMVSAIFLITGVLRKKEYAILKVSGFTTAHLFVLNLAETLLIGATSVLGLFLFSPVLNLATVQLFGVAILSAKTLALGVLMILGVCVVAYVASAATFVKIDMSTALQAGGKQ